MLGLEAHHPRLRNMYCVAVGLKLMFKDRIIFKDRGERRLVLLNAFLIFNFQTSLSGLNHLNSTYMTSTEILANKMFYL